jgi:acetylornithine deacetylase/succinyl-diaminopimelate desuccinylase family protein
MTAHDDGLARRVLASLDDQKIISLAQDLVRTNSVNSNLESGTTEQAISDRIASVARAAGLTVREQLVAPQRPNVLAVYPGRQEQIGIIFLAHTDTVPFLGMRDPLSADIVQDAIWGRGSVDMKGGLAAALMAVTALARSGIRLEKSVAIAAVVDEESEHRGAYALAHSGLRADACIVPEPSGMQLLLGCKGTVPIHIRVQGRLAHGSSPWLGINAIEKAARLIFELSQLPLGTALLPELETQIRGTLNIGVIQGGTAYNNVADRCSVFIDRRIVPGESQQGILKEIQGIVERLEAQDPEFKATIDISRPDWHWEEIGNRGLNPAYTPVNSAVAQTIERAHRATFNQDVRLGFSNGYMDMDFMVNDLGIPTVNYGPGDAELAHHTEECLPIEQLLSATRVFVRSAISLAC